MVIDDSKITQEDIDDLVHIADKDPSFKKALQKLDELANKRKCELKDVVQTAVDWYFKTQQKVENEQRN